MEYHLLMGGRWILVNATALAETDLSWEEADLCAVPPGFSLIDADWLDAYREAEGLSDETAALESLGVSDGRTDGRT